MRILSTQEKQELLAAAAAGWTTDRLIRETLEKVEREERRQGLDQERDRQRLQRDRNNTFGGHGGAAGGGGGTMSF